MNTMEQRPDTSNLSLSRMARVAPITIVAVCTFSALTGETKLSAYQDCSREEIDSETAEILADQTLMAELAEAQQNIADGELTDGPEDDE